MIVPSLAEEKLPEDPFFLFEAWYKRYLESARIDFPQSMCLSTIGLDGFPEGRVVLLRGYNSNGFVFYTNFDSNKGKAIEKCPRAALTFYWDALGCQVRARGSVEKVSKKEADEYFKYRPRGSQIGAWASKQSQVLEDRSILDERVKQFEQEYENREVPRPERWGGYRVSPHQMEFWQKQDFRLHDRVLYQKQENQTWKNKRLFP